MTTRVRPAPAVLGLLAVAVAASALLGLGIRPAEAAPTPTPVATTGAPTAAATTATTATTAPTAAPSADPASSGVVAPTAPTAPAGPTTPSGAPGADGGVSVNVGGSPSTSVTALLLLTVVSVAPSLLLMTTCFTKIFVVLSLTRNALGLTTVPPNQVLAGLSLFLSVFVMGGTFSKVNDAGIQPYLNGTKSREQAFTDGLAPLRDFMLHHTRPEEIALMLRAGKLPNPAQAADVGTTTLIPAFVLSELRAAMIIGFVIYLPFLVIDLVVSSSLMSLGMMMLPPVTVSLPFKLLLFVVVDGWGMVVTSLVSSYNTS